MAQDTKDTFLKSVFYKATVRRKKDAPSQWEACFEGIAWLTPSNPCSNSAAFDDFRTSIKSTLSSGKSDVMLSSVVNNLIAALDSRDTDITRHNIQLLEAVKEALDSGTPKEIKIPNDDLTKQPHPPEQYLVKGEQTGPA